MATDKEIQNEKRLSTLEEQLRQVHTTIVEVKNDTADIKEDVAHVKLTFAKAGGVLLGFTMIGAFFGYILTQLDKLKHFLSVGQ